jgi:formylglycine-generating enzyme required for sulfatase activity
MPFRPTVSTLISINENQYCFTEHPSARGMPYGQTGRRATVYQVQDDNHVNHALKVFTKAFRTHHIESSAIQLADFAVLPGLQVCSRQVITGQNDPALLGQYPDLQYAVLMPWVQGLTWQEIILARQPLTPEKSKSLVRKLVEILATMETAGIAHCDLSGANLLVDDEIVSLVDVEDLFAPGLLQPEKLASGSSGYAHKTAANGLWGKNVDRFAGAVLLAEILGWSDERVRRIATGEQYFDVNELQTNCDRYQVLLAAVTSQSAAAADLLAQAWYSKRLEDCPAFSDWVKALNANGMSGPSVDTLSDLARTVYTSAQEQVKAGNWDEVERQVHALQALAPGFSGAEVLLAQIRQGKRDARQQELEKIRQRIAVLEQQKQAIEDELAAARLAFDNLKKTIDADTVLPPEPPQKPATIPETPAPAVEKPTVAAPSITESEPKAAQSKPVEKPAVVTPPIIRKTQLEPTGKTSGRHDIYRFGLQSEAYKKFPESLGMEFVKVPAGRFLMGSPNRDNFLTKIFWTDGADDEKPLHTVNLTYDFFMARYTVTNARYAEYCHVAGLEPPVKDMERLAMYPALFESWKSAVLYIYWLNLFFKPLGLVLNVPSEAEWEKAARGIDGQLYPWGNKEPTENLCNFNSSGLQPVHRYSPQGDSPYGCAAMSGNAWEWTRSLYRPYPYNPMDGREDLGQLRMVIRGGSFQSYADRVHAACRGTSHSSYGVVGLRLCCRVL